LLAPWAIVARKSKKTGGAEEAFVLRLVFPFCVHRLFYGRGNRMSTGATGPTAAPRKKSAEFNKGAPHIRGTTLLSWRALASRIPATGPFFILPFYDAAFPQQPIKRVGAGHLGPLEHVDKSIERADPVIYPRQDQSGRAYPRRCCLKPSVAKSKRSGFDAPNDAEALRTASQGLDFFRRKCSSQWRGGGPRFAHPTLFDFDFPPRARHRAFLRPRAKPRGCSRGTARGESRARCSGW